MTSETEALCKHGIQFSEVNGDGWLVTCDCGEPFWRELEWQALRAHAEHEELLTGPSTISTEGR